MELADRSFNRYERRLLEDHFRLFASASESGNGSNAGYEEYLNLAGNSRPKTGAACLARRRNMQILNRLEISGEQLVRELGNTAIGSNPTRTFKAAELCKLLGDIDTANLLMDAARPATVSEASRRAEAVPAS